MAFPSNALTCPVCKQPLLADTHEKQFQCSEGHSFDRAKQGYLNLLLNSDKRSKSPGDSQEMVQARSNFLELGYYSPLLKHVERLANKHIVERSLKKINLCDIACGEGYYSANLAGSLECPDDIQVNLTGADISQPAIKAAARRTKQATWLVANAFKLPVASESQDIVTHLFSRPCIDEAERIINSNGLLIEVSTGDKHLIELRKILYPSLRSKPETENADAATLKLADRDELEFEFELKENSHILDLLTMTPHLFRAKKERIEKIKSLESIKLTGHFVIETYTK